MASAHDSSRIREQLRGVFAVFNSSVRPRYDQILATIREAHERGSLLEQKRATEERPTKLTYAVMRLVAELEATERLRAATRSYHAPGGPPGRTVIRTPHITRGPNTVGRSPAIDRLRDWPAPDF